jgi:hypothetical protein
LKDSTTWNNTTKNKSPSSRRTVQTFGRLSSDYKKKVAILELTDRLSQLSTPFLS